MATTRRHTKVAPELLSQSMAEYGASQRCDLAQILQVGKRLLSLCPPQLSPTVFPLFVFSFAALIGDCHNAL